MPISYLVFLQGSIYHVLGMPDSGETLLPRMSVVAYILPRVSPGWYLSFLGMPDSGETLLPGMSVVAYILPRVSPGWYLSCSWYAR